MKDKTNEDWTVREARREAMHEMEKEIPMLASERTALRNWVGQGMILGITLMDTLMKMTGL